jgi:hypothetical protein
MLPMAVTSPQGKPMDTKKIIATCDGVDKWLDIAEGKDIDKGTGNCELCKKHRTRHFTGGLLLWECGECPVKEKTGAGSCDKTPYEKWTLHQKKYHSRMGAPYLAQCPICQEIALEEAIFLASLLPDEAWDLIKIRG